VDINQKADKVPAVQQSDSLPKAWITRIHNHNHNHNEIIRNGKVFISYDYDYDYDTEFKRVNRDLL